MHGHEYLHFLELVWIQIKNNNLLGTSSLLFHEEIFKLPESDYHDLIQDSQWSGVTNNGSDSAFTATGDGPYILLKPLVHPLVLLASPVAVLNGRMNAQNPRMTHGLPPTWPNHKYFLPKAGKNECHVTDGKQYYCNEQVKKGLLVDTMTATPAHGTPAHGAHLAIQSN
jgi:hypothetical protein